MTARLYAAIVAAERAVRDAQQIAYEKGDDPGFWTRIALDRAQATLMRRVVRHAPATTPAGESDAERLARWEASGYGSAGGSAADRLAELRRRVHGSTPERESG